MRIASEIFKTLCKKVIEKDVATAEVAKADREYIPVCEHSFCHLVCNNM